jgi:hypothetical protein
MAKSKKSSVQTVSTYHIHTGQDYKTGVMAEINGEALSPVANPASTVEGPVTALLEASDGEEGRRRM